jgi:hypothetical protein
MSGATLRALLSIATRIPSAARPRRFYQQARVGSERALGTKHLVTPTSIANFGLLYQARGLCSEAEQFLGAALAGSSRAFGRAASRHAQMASIKCRDATARLSRF